MTGICFFDSIRNITHVFVRRSECSLCNIPTTTVYGAIMHQNPRGSGEVGVQPLDRNIVNHHLAGLFTDGLNRDRRAVEAEYFIARAQLSGGQPTAPGQPERVLWRDLQGVLIKLQGDGRIGQSALSSVSTATPSLPTVTSVMATTLQGLGLLVTCLPARIDSV